MADWEGKQESLLCVDKCSTCIYYDPAQYQLMFAMVWLQLAFLGLKFHGKKLNKYRLIYYNRASKSAICIYENSTPHSFHSVTRQPT